MFEEFEISSHYLLEPRRVWVQADPARDAADCLIFLDAEFYIDKLAAPSVVDAVPGVSAIYLSHADLVARGKDFTCNSDFSAFLARDLQGWIEHEVGNFDRIHLCGLSLSGLAAVHATLEYPSAFDGILSQSPSAWWEDERLLRSLPSDKRCESRVWISVGDQETEEDVFHETEALLQKASQRDSVRRLAGALNGCCREVHHEEFPGGHDMACWAEELLRALSWLTRG